MMIGSVMRFRLMGLVAGIMLAAGNLNGWLAPLQWVSLAGLTVVASGDRSLKTMVLVGFYAGLGYTLPQMAVLRLPASITAILMADLILMIILVFAAAGMSLRRPSVLAAIHFAALVTILDWANFTLLPMWGTAQSFGRCWSQWPRLIGFVSITGISGIVFVSTALSAWIGIAIVNLVIRRRVSCAMFLMIFLTQILPFLTPIQAKDTLRVATVGYDSRKVSNQISLDEPKVLDHRWIEPIEQAAQLGARLVVFPELALEVNQSNREDSLQNVCETARRYRIAVVVGYYDSTENENRALLIPPTGRHAQHYTKTHLTPFEPFQRGTGRLERIRVDGVWIGAIICQDDNFTTLSREYGRLAVGLVAVPTMDWRTVRSPHLQNSILRAPESGYAIVRAAVDGVSAIISPRGIVLGRIDHLRDERTLLVADVPCGRGRTIYARYGDWIVWVSILIIGSQTLKFWHCCPNGLCLLCPVYLQSHLNTALQDQDIQR